LHAGFAGQGLFVAFEWLWHDSTLSGPASVSCPPHAITAPAGRGIGAALRTR
jgi:hypothetical protein